MPRMNEVVRQHLARGDNTRRRRKKAFRLMGELCGWNERKKRYGGVVKKERKERIEYIHIFLIHWHQLFYTLIFSLSPSLSPYC